MAGGKVRAAMSDGADRVAQFLVDATRKRADGSGNGAVGGAAALMWGMIATVLGGWLY